MPDYQLLVIGAGPGGYTAALRAAKLGLKTAVVEAREAGGACLNRGCVPTKTLLHASELYHAVREGAAFGIHAEGLRADIGGIFAHKREVSRTLSQGVESLLKAAKVPLIRGRGQVSAPHAVPGAFPVISCPAQTRLRAARGGIPRWRWDYPEGNKGGW